MAANIFDICGAREGTPCFPFAYASDLPHRCFSAELSMSHPFLFWEEVASEHNAGECLQDRDTYELDRTAARPEASRTPWVAFAQMCMPSALCIEAQRVRALCRIPPLSLVL